MIGQKHWRQQLFVDDGDGDDGDGEISVFTYLDYLREKTYGKNFLPLPIIKDKKELKYIYLCDGTANIFWSHLISQYI